MLRLPRLRSRTSKRGRVSYYFDHGGTPRRWEPLGSNGAQARAKYDALIAAPKPRAGTVDAMLADALEYLRPKVTAGTLRNYRGYRKHLAAVFSDPTAITQADVLRYLRLCPRMSFRNEIALLSQGFAVWMDRGLLDWNPCFGVRCKRAGSRRNRFLTAPELDAIVAHADERLAVAIELAYSTGLRIGDLCRLRWADLDNVFRTQKTGARVAIEHGEVLAPILARAKALQGRIASLSVLLNSRHQPWTPDALRRRWDAACAAAGVQDAHWHDIRAAAATEVARLYGSEAAKEFLGHRSLVTTLAYLRDRRATVLRPVRRTA